jgi:hypothetical protein
MVTRTEAGAFGKMFLKTITAVTGNLIPAKFGQETEEHLCYGRMLPVSKKLTAVPPNRAFPTPRQDPPLTQSWYGAPDDALTAEQIFVLAPPDVSEGANPARRQGHV